MFVGDQAGGSNTTGNFGTAIGDGAGFSNTTEYGNTFLGSDADGVAGIENATAIGTSGEGNPEQFTCAGEHQRRQRCERRHKCRYRDHPRRRPDFT